MRVPDNVRTELRQEVRNIINQSKQPDVAPLPPNGKGIEIDTNTTQRPGQVQVLKEKPSFQYTTTPGFTTGVQSTDANKEVHRNWLPSTAGFFGAIRKYFGLSPSASDVKQQMQAQKPVLPEGVRQYNSMAEEYMNGIFGEGRSYTDTDSDGDDRPYDNYTDIDSDVEDLQNGSFTDTDED